jgi:hypothetical protein
MFERVHFLFAASVAAIFLSHGINFLLIRLCCCRPCFKVILLFLFPMRQWQTNLLGLHRLAFLAELLLPRLRLFAFTGGGRRSCWLRSILLLFILFWCSVV